MADPLNGINNTADFYRDLQIQSAVQRASNTSEATLGMGDFIKLLVAQLQNQDMLNPMDNTEFIAQMATFSSLTAMNNLVDQSMTSYAVSLLGKEVTAAAFNNEGILVRTDGVVTGVSLFEGKPKIYIGDVAYDLQSVMTVGKLPETSKPGGGDYSVKPVPSGADNEIKLFGTDSEGRNTYIEIANDGAHMGIWSWDADKEIWEFEKHTPGGNRAGTPPVTYYIDGKLEQQSDGAYIEIDKDGAFAGRWAWDADKWKWEFDKYGPPTPNTVGNKVEAREDGSYLEFDKGGNHVGVWAWDASSWIWTFTADEPGDGG